MKTFIIIFTAIITLAAFSNVQAQSTAKNPDLPDFQYLLTSKPDAERQQLCDLNEGFCQTNCGGPEKAPMNFCNSTTMGWGCGCIDKVPDLLGYQWPINREHCIGSGEACKAACQDPKVPNEQKANCNNACVETYTQKCGTPDQPPAYYAVSDPSIVPTYAPPVNTTSSSTNSTSSTSNTNGSSSEPSNNASENKKQSSASSLYHLGNAAAALVIVASGMSLL
ncbi:hypothetical protein C1645_756504 [Glomus cerebriforme]|uniref:DUF7707 domain-containing protein n=1 Tax=Glomus cerebriforme TaxID=658196 RepID=A0A397THD4_9GLOM|nr:hypothetical protein C1645_756504 [Glomus cerebriforme]